MRSGGGDMETGGEARRSGVVQRGGGNGGMGTGSPIVTCGG